MEAAAAPCWVCPRPAGAGDEEEEAAPPPPRPLLPPALAPD